MWLDVKFPLVITMSYNIDTKHLHAYVSDRHDRVRDRQRQLAKVGITLGELYNNDVSLSEKDLDTVLNFMRFINERIEAMNKYYKLPPL